MGSWHFSSDECTEVRYLNALVWHHVRVGPSTSNQHQCIGRTPKHPETTSCRKGLLPDGCMKAASCKADFRRQEQQRSDSIPGPFIARSRLIIRENCHRTAEPGQRLAGRPTAPEAAVRRLVWISRERVYHLGDTLPPLQRATVADTFYTCLLLRKRALSKALFPIRSLHIYSNEANLLAASASAWSQSSVKT